MSIPMRQMPQSPGTFAEFIYIGALLAHAPTNEDTADADFDGWAKQIIAQIIEMLSIHLFGKDFILFSGRKIEYRSVAFETDQLMPQIRLIVRCPDGFDPKNVVEFISSHVEFYNMSPTTVFFETIESSSFDEKFLSSSWPGHFAE